MDAWVTIVGAGPAGLLLALLLAQKQIQVLVLEQSAELDAQPRATHYAPPAVYELRRAGVLGEAREKGFTPKHVTWKKPNGENLAVIDNSLLQDYPDQYLCMPLNIVAGILHKHLIAQPTAKVLWNHRVKDIGQDADQAWVEVETPDGQKTFRSRYVVGCDGANSQVRRSLFGDLEFPGKTWDIQMVATNIYYDFEKFGWHEGNFIVGYENWFMAAKITEDGLWRVTYGEVPGLSHEEYVSRQPWKFETILPGNPKPGDYRIANFSPYKVHQRLAKSMRVGRFLLAADAAHLCNPMGGLGLTGGFVDAGNLFDCLAGIYEGLADETILDEYNKIRRQKYQEYIDPISTQNLLRLSDNSPETEQQRVEFFNFCKEGEKNPDLLREALKSLNCLQHDFRSLYRDTKPGTGEVKKDGPRVAGAPPVTQQGSG